MSETSTSEPSKRVSLQTAFDLGFAAVKTYVDGELGDLSARMLERLEAAEARLEQLDFRAKALEMKPGVEYRGVWQDGQTYPRGSFVSKGGSMWHAQRDTSAAPSESEDWRLAVKRGRDGKHARDDIR